MTERGGVLHGKGLQTVAAATSLDSSRRIGLSTFHIVREEKENPEGEERSLLILSMSLLSGNNLAPPAKDGKRGRRNPGKSGDRGNRATNYRPWNDWPRSHRKMGRNSTKERENAEADYLSRSRLSSPHMTIPDRRGFQRRKKKGGKKPL